ncbi:MAG: lipase maturation factor family protein [Gammaproteobacteria bacterium]|nr:lipase maturation factor family protein [Gammaproteobacteria bacterium]
MNTNGVRTLLEHAPEQQLTSRLFLKTLALIYFAAFYSLSGQIVGLAGSDGILPFDALMARAGEHLGADAWLQLPSLFWFYGSDRALQYAAWLGCLFSVTLLLGIRPLLSLLALFLLYLSLATAGQIFLNFQWDYLLLEAGFLAIFLHRGANRLTILLFHWLLFRLRFMSGVAKLASGDPSWRDLSALRHYFETQPLPHVGAWYAHQLPELLLQAGTAFALFSELVVPFFIFLPRRMRLSAAAITLFMQLCIIATSNHNFFNLLTIALCLFLLDDRLLERWLPAWLRPATPARREATGRLKPALTLSVALLILSVSLPLMFTMVTGIQPHRTIAVWSDAVRRFGIGNAYHVFPTMQTERIELLIEGSRDGSDWQPYRFRWRPDDPARPPAFIVPHQPRLDWLLWFAPTQAPPGTIVLDRLLHRLVTGSEPVSALLEHDPFSADPPRYIRILAYRYRFTSAQERAASGAWWQREFIGHFPYIPPRRP